MQYVPADGLYLYFRYDEKQTIMCIMNTDSTSKQIDFKKYAERTMGFSKASDIINSNNYNTSDKFLIPAKEMLVLELLK